MIGNRIDIFKMVLEMLKPCGIEITDLKFRLTGHEAKYTYKNCIVPGKDKAQFFFSDVLRAIEHVMPDERIGWEVSPSADGTVGCPDLKVDFEDHHFNFRFRYNIVFIDYTNDVPCFSSQIDIWTYLSQSTDADPKFVYRTTLTETPKVHALEDGQLCVHLHDSVQPGWQFDCQETFYGYKNFTKRGGIV